MAGLASAGGGAQFELHGLAAAPWDWSLKCRVRVASPSLLSLLRDAAAAGLAPAARAAAAGGRAPADAAPPAERLAGALLQWQHPAAPLAPDALAVMAASASTRDLLSARTRAWRDALRALHAAVRAGELPAAYVVGAAVRGGRLQWSAVCGAAACEMGACALHSADVTSRPAFTSPSRRASSSTSH